MDLVAIFQFSTRSPPLNFVLLFSLSRFHTLSLAHTPSYGGTPPHGPYCSPFGDPANERVGLLKTPRALQHQPSSGKVEILKRWFCIRSALCLPECAPCALMDALRERAKLEESEWTTFSLWWGQNGVGWRNPLYGCWFAGESEKD